MVSDVDDVHAAVHEMHCLGMAQQVRMHPFWELCHLRPGLSCVFAKHICNASPSELSVLMVREQIVIGSLVGCLDICCNGVCGRVQQIDGLCLTTFPGDSDNPWLFNPDVGDPDITQLLYAQCSVVHQAKHGDVAESVQLVKVGHREQLRHRVLL